MNKWKFIEENYINKGLKIFPIVPNGKTPLIEKWQDDCSCDYFQVLYWYETFPNCNWGLPCTPNNLFVLDLDRHDPEKDGVENFSFELLEECERNELNNRETYWIEFYKTQEFGYNMTKGGSRQ